HYLHPMSHCDSQGFLKGFSSSKGSCEKILFAAHFPPVLPRHQPPPQPVKVIPPVSHPSLVSLPYGGYHRFLKHLDYLGMPHSMLDAVLVPDRFVRQRFMNELISLASSTEHKYVLSQRMVDFINYYRPRTAPVFFDPGPVSFCPDQPVLPK